MRRPIVNMQMLINNNKKEILSDKKEIARIEKEIEDKHNKRLQLNK
ncbi:FbpB family small basic protein [Neobacillus mesonae]|nr:FbpB family small basic protein [Neobacillus mesonae]MCM3567378.1 FbpB family small basic protein [Neobacillus mesonae]